MAALFLYFDSKTISGVGGLCFKGATTKKGAPTFLRKNVHPGDLA